MEVVLSFSLPDWSIRLGTADQPDLKASRGRGVAISAPLQLSKDSAGFDLDKPNRLEKTPIHTKSVALKEKAGLRLPHLDEANPDQRSMPTLTEEHGSLSEHGPALGPLGTTDRPKPSQAEQSPFSETPPERFRYP